MEQSERTVHLDGFILIEAFCIDFKSWIRQIDQGNSLNKQMEWYERALILFYE